MNEAKPIGLETMQRIQNVRRSLITKAQQQKLETPELEVDRAMLYATLHTIHENNDLSTGGLKQITAELIDVLSEREPQVPYSGD